MKEMEDVESHPRVLLRSHFAYRTLARTFGTEFEGAWCEEEGKEGWGVGCKGWCEDGVAICGSSSFWNSLAMDGASLSGLCERNIE